MLFSHTVTYSTSKFQILPVSNQNALHITENTEIENFSYNSHDLEMEPSRAITRSTRSKKQFQNKM